MINQETLNAAEHVFYAKLKDAGSKGMTIRELISGSVYIEEVNVEAIVMMIVDGLASYIHGTRCLVAEMIS